MHTLMRAPMTCPAPRPTRAVLLLMLAAAAVLLAAASGDGIIRAEAAVSSCNDTLLEDRPIRIGVVGEMNGDIGALLGAVVSGMRIACHELNTKQNGVNGRHVEVITADTQDIPSNQTLQMRRLMSNRSTEVDVFAFTPSRSHIDVSYALLEELDMAMFSPVAGDLKDFDNFNKRIVNGIINPQAEIEAIVRYFVLDRQIRRVAMMVTRNSFGVSLVPYVENLMGELGLELSYVFMVDEPTRPTTVQIAEAASKRIQAVLCVAALYASTAMFVAQLAMANPTAQIATTGSVFPIVYAAFGLLPQYGFPTRDEIVLTAHYVPFPYDSSYAVIRHLRAAATEAYTYQAAMAAAGTPLATPIMDYPLQVYDAVPTIGQFFTAGFILHSVLLEAIKSIGIGNGRVVDKHSILEAIYSDRTFHVDDWEVGPFINKEACAAAGASSSSPIYSRKARSECQCNAGGRYTMLSMMNKNRQFEPMPNNVLKFSKDECIHENVIQSPLIQLVTSIDANATMVSDAGTIGTRRISEAQRDVLNRAVETFVAGDRAGYVSMMTSPSSRTGIVMNYSFVSDQNAELAEVEVDRLVTVAVGGAYVDPIGSVTADSSLSSSVSSVFSITIDPLFPVPQLHGDEKRRRQKQSSSSSATQSSTRTPRTIHLLATLEQEIHAFASIYGDRPIHVMTTVGSSLSSHVEGEHQEVAGGGGDGDDTLAALDEAFRKSTNTFGYARTGGASRVVSISYGLKAVSDATTTLPSTSLESTAASAYFLHGIASEADIIAINATLSLPQFQSVVVLVPFQSFSLWYGAFVRFVTVDSVSRRIIYATNLPSWSLQSSDDEIGVAATTTAAASSGGGSTSSSGSNTTASASEIATQTTLMKSYRAVMRANAAAASSSSSSSDTTIVTSPRSLQGFLTQRFIATIVERIPSKLSQETFITTLFAVSVIVVDANAFTVGPFTNLRCAEDDDNSPTAAAVTATSAVTECEVNIGARRVEVRRMNRGGSLINSGNSNSAARSMRIQADTSSSSSSSSSLSISDELVGTLQFANSQIAYKDLPTLSSESNANDNTASALVIGIVVAAAFVVVVLIAMLIGFKFCSGRSHANAPKDSSEKFTVVFTDIQSSTGLWAEVPDAMTKALEIHHKIIRKLIKKHNGYEVKTIGDSFMIVFKRADDAVRLASDIQYQFYVCSEFSPLIDQAYLSFDNERLMMMASSMMMEIEQQQQQEGGGEQQKAFGGDGENAVSAMTAASGRDDGHGGDFSDPDREALTAMKSAASLPPLMFEGSGTMPANAIANNTNNNLSCQLSPDAYKDVWSGLRVRVGIHTGFGDIKKDEVTNAYDYYGTVTNTAARVEAVCHGGQVCITQGTFEELLTYAASGEANQYDDKNKKTTKRGNDLSIDARTGIPPFVDLSALLPHPFTTNQEYLYSSSKKNKGRRKSTAAFYSDEGNNGFANKGLWAEDKHSKVTNNTTTALMPAPLPSVAYCLGPIELRGLADPVVFYQLECFPFGRRFPQLRLEVEVRDDENEQNNNENNNNRNNNNPKNDDNKQRRGGGAGGGGGFRRGSDASSRLRGGDGNYDGSIWDAPPTPAPTSLAFAEYVDQHPHQHDATNYAPSVGSLRRMGSESSLHSHVHNANHHHHYASGGMAMTSTGAHQLPDHSQPLQSQSASSSPLLLSVHIMSTIATMFSVIPTVDQRNKELRKMCGLWRVRVDRSAVEGAKLWGKHTATVAAASPSSPPITPQSQQLHPPPPPPHNVVDNAANSTTMNSIVTLAPSPTNTTTARDEVNGHCNTTTDAHLVVMSSNNNNPSTTTTIDETIKTTLGGGGVNEVSTSFLTPAVAAASPPANTASAVFNSTTTANNNYASTAAAAAAASINNNNNNNNNNNTAVTTLMVRSAAFAIAKGDPLFAVCLEGFAQRLARIISHKKLAVLGMSAAIPAPATATTTQMPATIHTATTTIHAPPPSTQILNVTSAPINNDSTNININNFDGTSSPQQLPAVVSTLNGSAVASSALQTPMTADLITTTLHAPAPDTVTTARI